MNVFMHKILIAFLKCISLGCIPRNRDTRSNSVSVFKTFDSYCQMVFQKVWINLFSYQRCMRVLILCHPCQEWVFLFDFVNFIGKKIVSCFVFLRLQVRWDNFFFIVYWPFVFLILWIFSFLDHYSRMTLSNRDLMRPVYVILNFKVATLNK